MREGKRPPILCVDDEQNVLDGIRRHLRRKFDVTTATSGRDGLDTIASAEEPFTVVLSDMKMPGMDGAAFLAKVRVESPDSVRMLLTGQAGLAETIAAINDGRIFQFLSKPCPPDTLIQAVENANRQYELITSEKVLLEQTLQGSITVLTEILSLAKPEAFGRASRLRQYVTNTMSGTDGDKWAVEIAAMLSQLGTITLPSETIERLYYGKELSDEEKHLVEESDRRAEELLAHIPRIEPVREILRQKDRPFEGDESIPTGARLLRIASDFDLFQAKGLTVDEAIARMRKEGDAYDPTLLERLAEAYGGSRGEVETGRIDLDEVEEGMILAEDLFMSNGTLLIARGQEITAPVLAHIHNFSRTGRLAGSIRVRFPRGRESALSGAGTGTGKGADS